MFHFLYSLLNIFCSIFLIPHSIFLIPYSSFHIPYSIFLIPYSLFHIPYSIFEIQWLINILLHCALDIRLLPLTSPNNLRSLQPTIISSDRSSLRYDATTQFLKLFLSPTPQWCNSRALNCNSVINAIASIIIVCCIVFIYIHGEDLVHKFSFDKFCEYIWICEYL